MADMGVDMLNNISRFHKFENYYLTGISSHKQVYFVEINCSSHEFHIYRNTDAKCLCEPFKFRLCIFNLSFVMLQSTL